ncbi:MAG: GNAT family N-acetyltransferase [Thiohalocapsa sp.]
MTDISCRPAALADAAEIHALLLRLAPEMPLLVDTLEREEALYTMVRNCARSGESWVAVDGAGTIVAVALAEPAQHARHYAEQEVLELTHAGVVPEHRNHGVFAALIRQLCARMAPVTASVPAHNRCDAAARLQRLGFRPIAGENRLRWEPGTVA